MQPLSNIMDTYTRNLYKNFPSFPQKTDFLEDTNNTICSNDWYKEHSYDVKGVVISFLCAMIFTFLIKKKTSLEN